MKKLDPIVANAMLEYQIGAVFRGPIHQNTKTLSASNVQSASSFNVEPRALSCNLVSCRRRASMQVPVYPINAGFDFHRPYWHIMPIDFLRGPHAHT
jgi:hypothetical protein